MDLITSLRNPLHKDLPIPYERQIVGGDQVQIPSDFRIVSADNHWDVVGDIFVERLPDHLKARAPRVWVDKFSRIGFADEKGELQTPFQGELVERILIAANSISGCWDTERRMRDLDADGIDTELNFPNIILFLFGHPDLELKEEVFRIYNQHMIERAAQSGWRSHGVGVVPNWWDPDKAEKTVQEMVDLGLKTFLLPVKPGNGLDGKPIMYSEPGCDRLMKAIEESGIPLCFHIGEVPFCTGRGGWGITNLGGLQPFVPIFAQMVFGGILDRCPKLQVVSAEGGLSWALPTLQDAEATYDMNAYLLDPLPKLRPTEYWRRNMHATFMNDRLGLSHLEILGADRVMWAQDYPHSEGTFGYSRLSMQTVIEMAGPEAARQILGGTAAKLFKI